MQFSGSALLVSGSQTDIPAVLSLLSRRGIAVEGNPDFLVRTYAHFGIDEARELRERASSKSLGERRVFVIVAPSLTNEAQNALLKTLEEPPAGALFVFIVASPEMLLGTLRSRTQTLELQSSNSDLITAPIRDFLAASQSKRLDLLKPLFEKGEDDRRDMSAVLSFLSDIERALVKQDMSPLVREGVESLYRARAYITDKGSLVKPLLEQVALLVPVIK